MIYIIQYYSAGRWQEYSINTNEIDKERKHIEYNDLKNRFSIFDWRFIECQVIA